MPLSFAFEKFCKTCKFAACFEWQQDLTPGYLPADAVCKNAQDRPQCAAAGLIFL